MKIYDFHIGMLHCGIPKKFFLVMKITAFLLFVAIIQVSASSYAQNINLSETNAPLVKLFSEIKAQSGYNFLYTDDILKVAKSVTIKVKSAKINDVLDQIFANQPLTYTISNSTIVVKEKEQTILDRIKSALTSIPITGKITDQTGKQLPGVTITNKKSKIVAVSDADGNFNISADKGDILVFTFVGYSSKQVIVGDRGIINISLEQKTSDLNQVVVIGYGSSKKKDLTGSVSTVDAKDIENVPFNTVDNALAGKAAGVQVTKSDGTPGGAVRIRIRGSSSLLGGNDPLYVIDGVPLQVQSNYVNPGYSLGSPMGNATSGGNSVVSNVGISGLSSSFINGLNSLGGLNPDDIESITILKDASSTAIYGSKAANGVVIITTKRGKNDMKPVITVSYYATVSSQYNAPHLLDANQYKSLLTEAAKNQVDYNAVSGNSLSDNADLILNHPGSFFGTANTNWVNEVTRTTVSHNAEVAVQGGSNSSKYFSSISYNSTPGVVKATDFQRISGKINLENDISSKFRFVTNIILGYTNQNIGDNAYAQALGVEIPLKLTT